MSCKQRSFLEHARHLDLPPMHNCALLLIDWQHAFVDEGRRTFLCAAPRALRRARALSRAFEAARLPVVVTRHVHRRRPRAGGMGSWWSSFLMEGDPASACVEALVASGRSNVLDKTHYSAFRGTGLQGVLRAGGVGMVVIAGVMTHICVESTARDAFMRGFDVVVAHDACASKSQRLHEASLLTMSHAVARVHATARIVAALRGRS